MPHVTAIIYAYGYLGIIALLMLGIVGLPVPDEWLLIFSGYLVFQGHFRIAPTLAAAIVGSVCGISVSYLLGRTLGITFVRRYGHLLRITDETMDRVQDWFARIGRWILLVGYFIPGVRHLAGFVAGTSKFRYREFALFAYSGASVWSTSFVAVGYFSGKEWAGTSRGVHRDILIGVVLAAGIILAYLLISRRGRRKE